MCITYDVFLVVTATSVMYGFVELLELFETSAGKIGELLGFFFLVKTRFIGTFSFDQLVLDAHRSYPDIGWLTIRGLDNCWLSSQSR